MKSGGRLNEKEFIYYSDSAFHFVILSACTQPEAAIQPATATQEATATLEPTPVPTPFPKLEVTENLSNAVGSYSEEQLAVMGSEDFEEKVDVINDWWLYWAYSAEDQQPLLTGLTDINIVPFFDEENPESCSLAIEAKMDDGEWHIFLLPIDTSKGEFRQYPPVEFGSNGLPLKDGYDIPEGFGPLDVTGNIGWTESFGWVRFDESGEMVETLNMETAQWEVLPEPEYEVLAQNSIDTSVSLRYVNSALMNRAIIDASSEVDFSLLLSRGFIISYEYGKKGNQNFLYLLQVGPAGVIKVQVDVLSLFDLGIIESVNDMTDVQMKTFLTDMDEYFMLANENGDIITTRSTYEGQLAQVTVGNQSESNNCLYGWDLSEPIGEFCEFDFAKDTLSREEALSALQNAFTARPSLSVAEILNMDLYTYTAGNNSVIYFQFFDKKGYISPGLE